MNPRRPRRGHTGMTGPTWRPRQPLRRVDAHVTRSTHQTMAWFRLAPQRWSFRSDGERERLLTAVAGQYAELAGRWLHLRVTSRPYSVAAWAQAHAANAHHRLPDTPGAVSWEDYLVAEQQHLLGAAMEDKQVFLGVQVSSRGALDRALERAARLLGGAGTRADTPELAAQQAELTHLERILARPGLAARPATPAEMQWLLHRSRALGLPAPYEMPERPSSEWETPDLASLDAVAHWHQPPFAPTVTVTGQGLQHAGQQRHVAVLSVGPASGLDIPEVDLPWMALADRLPTPVEWSARIYVRPSGEVSTELGRQANKVRSQYRHYTDEHQLDPPLALDRQQDQVAAVEDEMTSGFAALSSRVRSWWRVAVAGDTETEALGYAQELVDTYAPKITLEHPEGQHALATEFLPGAPLAAQVHTRRAPVTWVAAALPQVSATIGDRRGILLGETLSADRRPVAWDPWRAQEVRNSSGLTAVVAGLGAGKSFLGGGIVYKTLRSGAMWTVLDPSGPLTRLAQLPEIAPYARVIDLLHAQPGILNPYRVVPSPVDSDYDLSNPAEAQQLRTDHTVAEAARRRLTRDLLSRLLPVEIARDAATRAVLLEAIRRVGGRADAHPGMVIDELGRLEGTDHAAHARVVYQFLDEMRDQLRLLIPDDPTADPYAEARDDRLTVLSMAGLTLPKDGSPREEWTDAETLGIELLNLAAWLTQRMVYEGPSSRREDWRNRRKGVWIDEAFFLTEVPTGRMLMNRFARDSRKWNVRVLLSSQLPSDFLQLAAGGGGFGALLDSVFVGALDDEQTQADALRLLGVPTDARYEQTIGDLRIPPTDETAEEEPPRQFLFGDGEHGVEAIAVDYNAEHLTGLRTALDTTPGRTTPDAENATADDAEPGGDGDEPVDAETWLEAELTTTGLTAPHDAAEERSQHEEDPGAAEPVSGAATRGRT